MHLKGQILTKIFILSTFHVHADNPSGRKQEGLKMLLVRVVLGRCYVHMKDEELTGLPCKRRGCFTPDCTTHQGSRFDSLVAGTNKRFLEFLICNKETCYVPYCIEYNRV